MMMTRVAFRLISNINVGEKSQVCMSDTSPKRLKSVEQPDDYICVLQFQSDVDEIRNTMGTYTCIPCVRVPISIICV